ncbi:MAG TPA: ABC transporter substrate-binding protein/permease [Planctomycetota bacterium]|nr:ABC transporter substrate-binding protein/permease [Planctomycetota bacterium]
MRFLALLLLATAAFADDSWDRALRSGVLRWGADEEGGGPYVFRDDDERLTGFEVDLADAIGRYLGVKMEFVQGQWDRLPDMLRADKIDVVLNGYEWTPDRVLAMEATAPYYVYALQLLARKGALGSWDELRTGATRKVGCLTGSAAHELMEKLAEEGAPIEVVGYDGNTDAMKHVETGNLDATLQDTPIASFYAPHFPALVPVGDPVAPGYYVMYAREGDHRLVNRLNEALIVLFRNGELERIYAKYGMWTKEQGQLATILETGRFFGFQKAALSEAAARGEATAEEVRIGERKRGWAVVTGYGMQLVRAAGITVVLSLLSFPLAVAAGILIALGRLYGPRWLRPPLAFYVEFLRGTPLMLQLYFIFFFLPELGVNIPAFACAILGLAINYSAYESEIYRAGILAIPRGQMEAALSLGMPRRTALRRIVVPQAARIVVPPVVNDFIALFKDTSVCSVVTIIELTKRFSVLSQSTQATVELMLLTGALYLLMSYPLSIVSRRLEQRLEAA